jgi:tetratricopeptide (TPR) repeat protein
VNPAIWTILTVTLCSWGFAEGQSAAAGLFNEGNAHYRHGEYAAAREKYEQVADTGIRNASLFYNLGNACFKIERLGEAILWYERARRLEPRDPDIWANLQFANLVKKDRDEPADENVVVVALRQAFAAPSLNELSLLLTFALIGVLAIACRRLWAAEKTGAVWTTAMGSAVTVLIFSALFLGARAADDGDDSTAIVTVTREIARSAPEAGETVVFVIHEGTKVRVQRQEKSWVLIRLPNGLGGWLPRAAITII